MFKIIEKNILNGSVTQLKIEAPFIAEKVKAGQFVIVRIDEKGERIPLTVSDFDRENGTVTIVVQAIGFTTKKLVSLNAGDYIKDVVGPLGCPTEFGTPKKAIIIGGGVSNAGDLIVEAVRKSYRKHMYLAEGADIRLATLGNDAGIYGAVRMVL